LLSGTRNQEFLIETHKILLGELYLIYWRKTLTKLKTIAELSYIPFGAVLLFIPVDVLIKAIILFSIIPSALVGLKNPQRSVFWKCLNGVLNGLLPVFRIEFAVMGMVAVLPSNTATLLWILATNLALSPLFVWILEIWINATIRAIWEDDYKPKLFRKLIP
jgi:hypothetical protein